MGELKNLKRVRAEGAAVGEFLQAASEILLAGREFKELAIISGLRRRL